MKKSMILSMSLLFLLGCATAENPQKSNLTPGMAKTSIIKGETTQNDLLELFGAPNIITQNKTGHEVWTYDKVSVDAGASESFGTLIILGRSGWKSSASAKTFTLMIEFDDNDVVSEYSYRSSEF